MCYTLHIEEVKNEQTGTMAYRGIGVLVFCGFMLRRCKMILAQKLHSEEEMEKNRIEFYRRFEKDQPHLTYELIYEEGVKKC